MLKYNEHTNAFEYFRMRPWYFRYLKYHVFGYVMYASRIKNLNKLIFMHSLDPVPCAPLFSHSNTKPNDNAQNSCLSPIGTGGVVRCKFVGGPDCSCDSDANINCCFDWKLVFFFVILEYFSVSLASVRFDKWCNCAVNI